MAPFQKRRGGGVVMNEEWGCWGILVRMEALRGAATRHGNDVATSGDQR
jgi:hypothetical protein